MRVADRIAIVTGAAGAIGAATALALAREGADVVLVDVRPTTNVAKAIRAQGRRALALACDVSRKDAVNAMAGRALRHFGRVDILVNIAGLISRGAGATVSEPEWRRVLAVNLDSVLFCIQAAIPAMRRQRYGRIVNMGSLVGKNGGNARPWIDAAEQDATSNVAYGVSKAGVHALTVFFARELASEGITVNAVAPGPVASAMSQSLPESIRQLLPVGRIGTPEDVADAIVFLAGDAAAFVTGEVLDVNGGMWCD